MEKTFKSSFQLADALRRAADAHHAYEHTLGHADENWPTWYAKFMMDEQREPTEQDISTMLGKW